MAETLEVVRAALHDEERSQPFHLMTTIEGLECTPTADAWPLLFASDGPMRVFEVQWADPRPEPDTEWPGLGMHVVVHTSSRVFPIGATSAQ